ncbi:sensor domain-containing phosphodiesterase [Simiduia agarivorans]|uniref:GAF domain/GGDEF domain/EAL domain-containing protein n=1 Tax=Simiduia agarivorans (strain DSM 21679 / JCM 13881 / BCRC 17597 / SA1) TaxID=1117647 RepID=K4KJI3_SIMAS|nr:EAL domain-containing protein [Simiduia agarivorans]AFU99309.1 GAF domain/GGDEF domain/EAL domain-containing protein [Simiduia agarivorans SA1 = DSM 21679]
MTPPLTTSYAKADSQDPHRTQFVQSALFEIADLSYRASSLENLFRRAHAIIGRLMYAENFYIAVESKDGTNLSFPYYVDTLDPEPGDKIAETPLSRLDGSLSVFLVNHDTTIFTQDTDDFDQLLTRYSLKLVGGKPQCLIGVPLRWGEDQRGAMVVQSYLQDTLFTRTDCDVLSFLAKQISTALSRFEQRETLERTVAERTQILSQKNQELEATLAAHEEDKRRQEALYEISTLSHSISDLGKIYPRLHRILDGLFPAKNFYVSLLSEDGSTITFPYFADKKDISTKSRKLGNGATEYLLHLRKPRLLGKEEIAALIDEGELDPVGALPESWLGAPILIGDEAYGIIAAQSYEPDQHYKPQDLDLLRFAADQLAEALKRQQDSDALMLANITLEARVEQRTWELSEINSRLGAEIEDRRRAEEMQATLFSIDELTQSTTDMATIYQEIHRLIGRFVHAENFYIAEFNREKGKLYFPYYVDSHQDLDDFTEVSPDEQVPHMPLEFIDKTLTAYVIRTKQSLLADEAVFTQLEKDGEVGLVGTNPVDWLGIPLLSEGEVNGVIVVQTYTQEHRLTKQDQELLQFVSSHVATALERRQHRESLEARVQARTNELAETNKQLQHEIDIREKAEKLQAALFKIADVSSSTTDMETFYKQIHKIVGQLIYAKYFFIALIDDNQPGMLHFPYYADNRDRVPGPRPMGNHLSEWVIHNVKPMLVTPDNIAKISKKIQIKGKQPVSWLGVPLIIEGDAVGVLAVQTYDTDFVLGREEEELLTYVSHHVATALQRKSARDALERRVEQRTQELREVNLSLEAQIEKRREIEKQLEHDAFHDALTGLPNRALFMDRLGQLIAKGKRESRYRYAVLFLDLDRFKIINDSLGHLAGDKLLQEVSKRLVSVIRPQDTVARLGGDEFCLLLDDISGVQHAEQVAKRIGTELTAPFIVDGSEVFTSTSIGIAHSKLNYDKADAMLRDADAAMYQAKLLGKRQYVVFDQSMHKKALNTLKLETELRNAINLSEIDVYFQPIINLATGSPDGFEALARWQHANQGTISPADFIPLAEESGLIVELDLIICKKACLQLAQWQQKFKYPLSVSVNLSSKHFSRTGLVERIQDIIELSGISPASLKVEITESALMENVATAQRLLKELSQLGVRLAMDDFGTGYSSLSYLHRFPLDLIKIDRCFVDEIDVKKENLAIVKTIITLSEALNMTSVAEGVETQAQCDLVTRMGCQLGQGFLFSRPLSAGEASRWLENQIPAFMQPDTI